MLSFYSCLFCFRFYQIKIHLVNRATGKEIKQKVKCEAFFFMHVINCYEQDNHVIIDVNGYADTKFLHALHLKNIRVREPSAFPSAKYSSLSLY